MTRDIAKDPKVPSSPVVPSSPQQEPSLSPKVPTSPVQHCAAEDDSLTSNGSGDVGQEAAAAMAAAVTTAGNVSVSVDTNGTGHAERIGGDTVEDDASEIAGTSSDSGGEDDEERGGSSSAPGREEGQAGGAEATQTNGQQHGPVLSAVSAGLSAGNGHGSPHGSPRQETDEHAARASDAATAALMAALASATTTKEVSPRSTVAVPAPSTAATLSKPSPTAGITTSQSLKPGDYSEVDASAEAWEREAGGCGSSNPTMRFTRLPPPSPPGRGETGGERDSESRIRRIMQRAGFRWPRPLSPSDWDETGDDGDNGGGDCGDDSVGEPEADVPLPLELPLSPLPCMVGYFGADSSADAHRCTGTWAMNKADWLEAEKVESRASPFEIKVLPRDDGAALSFPHSGAYQGHFLVRQAPRPVLKVKEDELEVNFIKNSEGSWNVDGHGQNKYGSFSITGRLGSDRRLEVYRTYKPVAPKPAAPRAHRRVSSIQGGEVAAAGGTGAGAGGNAAPAPAHSLYGRTPGRGKHPRTDAPVAASISAAIPPGAVTASNGGAGEWQGDGGGSDVSHDTPPTGGRRVSRTPSYLIKDIGSEGTAHLSQGLRKCLTVLKSLMSVPRKSEWFLAPVDHVALQLIDYTRIIKRPMDLGTVRKNLESGQYQVRIWFLLCCVGSTGSADVTSCYTWVHRRSAGAWSITWAN